MRGCKAVERNRQGFMEIGERRDLGDAVKKDSAGMCQSRN